MDNYGSIDRSPEQDERVSLLLDPETPSSDWNVPRRSPWVWTAAASALLLAYAVVSSSSSPLATSNTPSVEMLGDPMHPRAHFYRQPLDHFHSKPHVYWNQRFFQYGRYFRGPGSPLFVVLGGEDPLDDLLYPFIWRTLAKRFNAYTISIEHRFYGESMPLKNPTNEELAKYLLPEQALYDFRTLIQMKLKELGCSSDKTSKHYCPVMTVGGSYPGYLSAMMRFVHGDVVDIGYASSAPLHLYDHSVDPAAYYEKVTDVAEEASPGCAAAVMEAQVQLRDAMVNQTVREVAAKLRICKNTIPKYMKTTEEMLEDLVVILATHFAESNMFYYPPSPEQPLVQQCQIFQDPDLSFYEKIANFLNFNGTDCFDLTTELPPGKYGRISASDWSGVGGDESGFAWDFQCCSWAPETAISGMFLERPWSLEWVTKYCERRFDFTPDPLFMVKEFGFDDLSGTTQLMFTNGNRDGWSTSSYMIQPPNSQIAVFNFESGCHHSDLTGEGPIPDDTPDMKLGYELVTNQIAKWLDDIRGVTTPTEEEDDVEDLTATPVVSGFNWKRYALRFQDWVRGRS